MKILKKQTYFHDYSNLSITWYGVMSKNKKLFITFEGIEGSGKSYQSKRLFNKIKKLKLPVLFTREPGGSKSAEIIRKVILTGSKNKFNNITDTLLYIAARNEHIYKTLKPAFRKKNIICDRYTDSTIAYQVHGKFVDPSIVDFLHKKIIGKIKPDITFLLKLNIEKAFQRLNKRKYKNRYDKFSKNFYEKVQSAFVKMAKSNTKRYIILDTSNDTKETESLIFNNFIKQINK
jgi:dTMP kinase